MKYAKTDQEILSYLKMDPTFYDAHIFWVAWKTDPDLLKEITPFPFEVPEIPLAFMYFANFGKCEAFGPYKECALFIGVQYKKKKGLYCLSMPVNNDMAVFGGREWLGYPKKMAKIQFDQKELTFKGSVERHGIIFSEMQIDLSVPMNNPESKTIINEYLGKKQIIMYGFRNFVDREGFNHWHPFKQRIKGKMFDTNFGNAKIIFRHSKYDPWIDIKNEEILGALYMSLDLEMNVPTYFAEVDELIHRKHAFVGWDF